MPHSLALLSVLALFLLACNEEKKNQATAAPAAALAPPPSPTAVTAAKTDPAAAGGGEASAAARDIFNQRCSTCHGAGGKGDGIAGAALNPKPRNFTDAAWQKSVSDTHLAKVIVEGGA